MDLNQRFHLQSPVEQRHQAAVAGYHVKCRVSVGQLCYRCALEFDAGRQILMVLTKQLPRACDHVVGIVNAMGLETASSRVLYNRVTQPASDIKRSHAIAHVRGGCVDLDFSQLIVACRRSVIQRRCK